MNQEEESKFKETLNPQRQVPVIIDSNNNNFTLYESNAILQYLCNQYCSNDNNNNEWYPLYPLETRSLIDQYLHFHHSAIRSIFMPCIKNYTRLNDLQQTKTLSKFITKIFTYN